MVTSALRFLNKCCLKLIPKKTHLQLQPQLRLQLRADQVIPLPPTESARITPPPMAQNGTTQAEKSTTVSGTRITAHKLAILTETIIAKATEIRTSMMDTPVMKLAVHVGAAPVQPIHLLQPIHQLRHQP